MRDPNRQVFNYTLENPIRVLGRECGDGDLGAPQVILSLPCHIPGSINSVASLLAQRDIEPSWLSFGKAPEDSHPNVTMLGGGPY